MRKQGKKLHSTRNVAPTLNNEKTTEKTTQYYSFNFQRADVTRYPREVTARRAKAREQTRAHKLIRLGLSAGRRVSLTDAVEQKTTETVTD